MSEQAELLEAIDHQELLLGVAGVDEVGRGCLAGAVVAAAVILDPERDWSALKDSKQLTPETREILFEEIIEHALAYAFGRSEVEEIDAINILNATLRAQYRAVMALNLKPRLVIVDGRDRAPLPYPTITMIKGDQLHQAVSAASIIAKVSRDREMATLESIYPGYGFAIHKGYGTKAHLAALKNLGPCAIHRKSFQPVAALLRQ